MALARAHTQKHTYTHIHTHTDIPTHKHANMHTHIGGGALALAFRPAPFKEAFMPRVDTRIHEVHTFKYMYTRIHTLRFPVSSPVTRGWALATGSTWVHTHTFIHTYTRTYKRAHFVFKASSTPTRNQHSIPCSA